MPRGGHARERVSGREIMLRIALLLAFLAAAAQGLVLGAPVGGLRVVTTQPSRLAASAPLTMTSAGKKAKAKTRKVKSSSAITKRFKATASGKLLRRKAFRAHILTKKHPLRKQRLRRISQVHEGQLKTMQACMLVTPKRP